MVNQRDYLNPLFPVTVTADLNYRETPTGTHKVDLFAPDTSPIVPVEGQYFPTIIYAHGGEFVYGSRKDGGPVKFCTEMAKRGYNCLSMEYPLISAGAYAPITTETNATACMHDVIRWCWQFKDTYFIDTSKIVVAGDSAGACMAVMSAIANMEGAGSSSYVAHLGKRPAAVLDFWGPTQIFGLPLGGAPFTTNIAAGKIDKLIMVHGSADAAVTPDHSFALKWIVETYRPTATPILRLLQGAGHTPWFRLISEEGFMREGFYEDVFVQSIVPGLKTMLGL